MASVRRSSSRRKPAENPAARLQLRLRLALAVFTLIVVLGPLAFGAVDQLTQVVLLVLFAVGLYLRPAVMMPLGRWGNRLAIALVGVLVLKEFLPATWFGSTLWREVLVEDFGLAVPWTHHPEPGRAGDVLLAFVVAGLWFAWVRTLASDRDARPVLGWALVASGAIVTAVSYSTQGLDPQAIYGLRFTPGWTGFGPFPNRNHTGNLLAMAFVLGLGCTAWAIVRKQRSSAVAGGALTAIIFFGLLGTHSRGGLIGAVFGMVCFFGLIFIKLRNRRVLAIGLSVALVAAAAAIVGGGTVLDRFKSTPGGDVSRLTRIHIWGDALRMWSDAPVFGHGAGIFGSVFGPYQTLRLEDQIVLHPESSWLQALAEFGLVPVALLVASLALFLAVHVRTAFERERGFYLRAGAFAAFAVIVAHSAIDVPAHRWGTMGFALAALAIGCPLRAPGHLPPGLPRAAVVPLGLAVFWVAPLVADWPAWSPLTAARVVDRELATGRVPIEELQNAAHHFPLNAQLQQALGIRQVRLVGRARPTVWQRHFAAAAALVPGSWNLMATQARAVARVAPGISIGYWQKAVDRCDLHREEVLGVAVRETARFPMSPLLWGRYVEEHPDLLLAYARELPDDAGRELYQTWWQLRALDALLTPVEIQTFYQQAARWGTREQFDQWMRARASWLARDYREWARVLHQFKDDRRAFEMLAPHYPEPDFPRTPASASLDTLEMKWRNAPKDVVNAQFLALARRLAGQAAQSDEIIVEVASKDYAPPWFLLRAAHIHARQQRFADAVPLLLRAQP